MRLRAVEALRDGTSISEVAKSYRVDRSTVHRWRERWKESRGRHGLRRKAVPGRPRKLDKIDDAAMQKVVLAPATNYGYETDFWTTTRLQQVINTEFELDVCRQTVWHRLREMGLTYQKPEPRYFEASEKARSHWQKTELPKIRATVARYKAVLYFEDESNISLSPVLARTWAPKGKTPVERATGKRGGVAALSAISKQGRLVFRLLEKRINSDDIIQFLSQLLRHHPRRHVVVVMDGASCHTSKKTKAFIQDQPRLHVFYLPSYSPDWNPDEQVWNHLKNHELKGHKARTKEELKRTAHQKLSKMQRNPRQLRGIFFRCCVAELF